uniref:Uncharacterized protein n=1 Tax=Herelleviridae sp. cttEB8 TaxID=2825832 RepID=A0A8S5P853_9CAUD|nr:MAG TPA: hypothetical protein [Herelleviridae sp. cttEB8]
MATSTCNRAACQCIAKLKALGVFSVLFVFIEKHSYICGGDRLE